MFYMYIKCLRYFPISNAWHCYVRYQPLSLWQTLAITVDILEWNLIAQVSVLQRDQIRGNTKMRADGFNRHPLSAFNKLCPGEIAFAQNVAGWSNRLAASKPNLAVILSRHGEHSPRAPQ